LVSDSTIFSKDDKFLRIVWCDNANIIRSKALRVNSNTNSEFIIGISRAQQAIPVTHDGVVPDSPLDPIGEVYLKADTSTITRLPYSPGHLRAMGDMFYNGSPWEYCPRGFLKSMVEIVGNMGLEIKASFENEFYLLNENEFLESRDKTPFASTLSMDLNHEIIMDIVDSIEAQGMVVEQYYPESGQGQHELTISYADALMAADNQVAFRETVRAVALKHGILSSFLPKIFPEQPGSGCHIHMSLWREGENITHDKNGLWELSKEARHFMAGVLNHLPALMAITTPTSNSYRRIQPHSWTGKYRCWGLDNREASIRVIREPEGEIKHFELKTSDATANPYLALGAMIKAGIDGLEKKLKLPEPVQLDPANLEDSERSELGIDDLPSNPGQAVEKLENNEVLINAIGKALSMTYIAVKKEEWKIHKEMSMAQEVELLIDKY